jgi:glutamyl-tRNA reductase
VSLRERMAYTSHRLHAALARLGCGGDPDWEHIQELAILSTCNRVELYAVAPDFIFETLAAFLSDTLDIPAEEFRPTLYHLIDGDATCHLFKVAAGLDSLVIGEPQILGQVVGAYAAARQHGTAGKILSRLFQTAIHAGKRARSETTINHNPASIASVAIQLISQTVKDLPSARVMVIGAGEMAELAVESLRKRGASQILVVNRTLQRAQELARRWQGQAAALEMLHEGLMDADIVICSTSAPHTVIHRSHVENAMQTRPERPLVLMDIAVPRDVDPEVSEMNDVSLFDMDTLARHLEISLAQRETQIPKVEAILAEEQAGFEAYLASLDVVPLIVELHQRADAIRQKEIAKATRGMPDLTPEMQKKIDALTASIVNKILHHPTTRLREEAAGSNAADYASLARVLFGLD